MKKIKIVKVNAVGENFSSLIPNSEHETVSAPEKFQHLSGVWVMGTNEPVRLLPGEYKVL